jgi:hypothetical protein
VPGTIFVQKIARPKFRYLSHNRSDPCFLIKRIIRSSRANVCLKYTGNLIRNVRFFEI